MFFQELPRPILEFITVLIICISILIFNFSKEIEKFFTFISYFWSCCYENNARN